MPILPALKRLALTAVFVLLLCGTASKLLADEPASVTMTASPSIIMADGKSTTTISAVCSLQGGRQVPDGTPINFSTTEGTLNAQSVSSAGGLARVTLTSGTLPGKALISANFTALGSGMSGQTTVEFTSDHSVANTDQTDQDWVRVSSRAYLSYGADDQVVDAYASKQGVRFAYRGVTIDADAMQVDLATNCVRARNAVMRRSLQTVVNASEIYYEFSAREGTAVIMDAPGASSIENVKFSGIDLKTEVVAKPPSSGKDYQFVDLSNDRVQVTAQDVSIKPGDSIRLRKATVYLDGSKVVSLPYHVMPLSTTQIFGQQILGVGTDGFFLDIPYYLSLTPHDSSMLFFRSPVASQQAGTFNTSDKGYTLDFQHTYQLGGNRGDGSFLVEGLSERQPGLQWHQTELFGAGTRAYFYVDSPTRNSLFTSGNFSHQFQWFSANVATSYSSTTGAANYSLKNLDTSTYFESKPRSLGGKPSQAINYVADISLQDGRNTQVIGKGTPVSTTIATRAASMRFYTPTYKATRNITVTNSVNFGDSYDAYSHLSGLTLNATSAMTFRLSKLTTATMNYNFVHNPLMQGTLLNANGLYSAPLIDTHQLGLSFFTGAPDNKWDMSFTSNFLFPVNDVTLTGGANYRLSGWRFGFSQMVSRTSGFFYKDLEVVTARRIGGREVSLTWSTLDHQIRINMQSAQF